VIRKLVISRDALQHNARALSELVGRNRAAFVVKSNAYGHGLIETARVAEQFGTRICVYGVEEAIVLRDAGVTKPILVLGPIPSDGLDAAVGANLELALWDTKAFAHALAGTARRRRRQARVHLKVNTGLNRLGFEPHELVDALEDYAHMHDLSITGIFSHLAAAEELDSPYTMHQLSVFEKAIACAKPLLERSETPPIRHIAASAAAMLWPETRLDLSRFGIALYGLWPSPQTYEAMNPNGLELQPALSYLSELVVVRSIKAGEAVGYGTTFHAPRTMRIGVVPVGYADGVPRELSNRGAFIVDGALCPIVGRVAMNMTEIDLTHAPSAHVESQVTLIGRDGGVSISADDWAEWSNTINYEIVTRLPRELPRVYVGDCR
jgi:alanine racemase